MRVHTRRGFVTSKTECIGGSGNRACISRDDAHPAIRALVHRLNDGEKSVSSEALIDSLDV